MTKVIVLGQEPKEKILKPIEFTNHIFLGHFNDGIVE
jgi:hypothetical protein